MQPQTMMLCKHAFTRYLSKSCWRWNWWVTQTFDYEKCGYKRKDGFLDVHSEICKESYHRFTKEIRKTAMLHYGFAFAELHKNGRPHWHALCHVSENLLGQPRRNEVWERMFAMYGRCEIRPVNAVLSNQIVDGRKVIGSGIARYLCKYVAKSAREDHAWWDFSGSVSGFEASASRIRAIVGVRPSEHG